MKAYSHDLRELEAAACAEPGAKIHQVAARFSVSLSFTDKLLHRQRTSGSVAELPRHPGPARPGPAPRLDAAGGQRLLTCLRAQPDATLAEIGQALAAAGGPSLQRTAAWQAVERLGWGRKKNVHAAERNTERVVAWSRGRVVAWSRGRVVAWSRGRVAPLVRGSHAERRRCPFRVRGRDEYQPDRRPPLRPCPGRPCPGRPCPGRPCPGRPCRWIRPCRCTAART